MWGGTVTLVTNDLIGFGPADGSNSITISCPGGGAAAPVTIASWSPQTIVCTLPATPLTGCTPGAGYALNVSSTVAGPCQYPIDVVATLDPAQLTAADLTYLASAFNIAVSVPVTAPPPGVPATVPIDPLRVRLVPPPATPFTFVGEDGTVLHVPRKWQHPDVPVHAMTRALAAAAQGNSEPHPPLRSPATMAALVGSKATTDARHATAAAAALDPGTAVTIDVKWTVLLYPLVGPPVAVAEDTFFKLVDPDNPAATAPTLTSLALGLLLRPWVTADDLRNPAAWQLATYNITATIRLSVGGVSGEPVTLAGKDLPAPLIAIPVVLLLFRDVNLGGPVLPCVPPTSPYSRTVADVVDGLRHVLDILGPVQTLVDVAAWVAGIEQIMALLPADTTTHVVRAGSGGALNLDDVRTDSSWYDPSSWSSWDWEEQVSSFAVLGPAATSTVPWAGVGSTLEFDNSFVGQFYLDIPPQLHALVLDLRTATPQATVLGTTNPNVDAASVSVPPEKPLFSGSKLTIVPGTFNDSISRLKFL